MISSSQPNSAQPTELTSAIHCIFDPDAIDWILHRNYYNLIYDSIHDL